MPGSTGSIWPTSAAGSTKRVSTDECNPGPGGSSGYRCNAMRMSAAGFSSYDGTALLPKPTRQTNVSFSRQGVIRGIALPRTRPGRPVHLPRGHCQDRRARSRDRRRLHGGHRRRQPCCRLHPRSSCARVRGPDRLALRYHVTEEYDPADPDEHGMCWADPRVAHLWSTPTPIVSPRDADACS